MLTQLDDALLIRGTLSHRSFVSGFDNGNNEGVRVLVDTHRAHEEEIIRSLLTLPKEVREHLVATYSDALAFFAQLGRMSHRQSMSQAIEKQQAMYGRIANALVDSLASDPPEAGST